VTLDLATAQLLFWVKIGNKDIKVGDLFPEFADSGISAIFFQFVLLVHPVLMRGGQSHS